MDSKTKAVLADLTKLVELFGADLGSSDDRMVVNKADDFESDFSKTILSATKMLRGWACVLVIQKLVELQNEIADEKLLQIFTNKVESRLKISNYVSPMVQASNDIDNVAVAFKK